MNVADQKEIIFTPEAKGMRVLPSFKGASVNFSRLKETNGIKLKSPRLAPTGRMENPAGYAKLKEEARFSKVSAGAPLFLQSDSQATNPGFKTSKLRAVSDFAGLDGASWTPPNSQIAAGPDHLLIAVNAAIAIFDKTGRQTLRVNLADLFSQLIQGAVIIGPRVIYDQFRDGWVIAACAHSAEERRSWFLLAYSTGPNPLDDWSIWAFDADVNGKIITSHWADDIGLSVDSNWLYLTANMFSANMRFLHSRLRILNKKELQSGGFAWMGFLGTPQRRRLNCFRCSTGSESQRGGHAILSQRHKRRAGIDPMERYIRGAARAGTETPVHPDAKFSIGSQRKTTSGRRGN